MPPKPIVPIEDLDLNTVVFDREAIRTINPHRYEFEQIHAVCLTDRENLIVAGYRDVLDDEFWVRGHIPGRPIFPGVLMIEASAQMCSVMYYKYLAPDLDHFFGFAGLEHVKFRGSARPGDRMVFMARSLERRSRKWTFETQAFIESKMVFEAIITGMSI